MEFLMKTSFLIYTILFALILGMAIWNFSNYRKTPADLKRITLGLLGIGALSIIWMALSFSTLAGVSVTYLKVEEEPTLLKQIAGWSIFIGTVSVGFYSYFKQATKELLSKHVEGQR